MLTGPVRTSTTGRLSCPDSPDGSPQTGTRKTSRRQGPSRPWSVPSERHGTVHLSRFRSVRGYLGSAEGVGLWTTVDMGPDSILDTTRQRQSGSRSGLMYNARPSLVRTRPAKAGQRRTVRTTTGESAGTAPCTTVRHVPRVTWRAVVQPRNRWESVIAATSLALRCTSEGRAVGPPLYVAWSDSGPRLYVGVA